MVSTFATENADEIISLKSEPAGTVAELSIKYRPHMHEFLEDMASKYELIVYSNFSNRQVQAIADCVEKRRKYFAYRFHDEFCLFANISSSVKCLDFLYSNRSLADIILVDARAKTLPLTVDNFVPLPTFSGDDPNDTELVKLAAVLDRLAEAKDVAAAIRGYRGEIPLST